MDFKIIATHLMAHFNTRLGKNLHYFDWLKERPYNQSAFNTTMGISRTDVGDEWFQFYPVEDKLNSEDFETLLVDVGGGLGHDLVALKKKFPNVSGKLIVQDLPVVVDAIEDFPNGIEAMKHNFFDLQPVREAKAYYLGTVLHDWPDKQARTILSNIKGAMKKNSVLLIRENVLPDSNVSLYSALNDLSMMAMFSALDRTPTQFRELLGSVGFELVKVWSPTVMVPGQRTLLEAVLTS